jgi:S1-C subfamily serine protease
VRQFTSIIAIAILLTATVCAPEKTEVSCSRPDGPEQLLNSARISFLPTDEGGTGIFFFNVPPDSFWACAGIEEGDLITEFNSRPVPKGPELLEMLELITRGDPFELSVQATSRDRRSIVIR